MTPGQLDGKVAIVTGGTSGIGLASALLFAREGAYVVIADIQDAVGADLAAASNGRISYVHTDVTQDKDIENAVSAAVAMHGHLDIMYNNAGAAGDPSGLLDITAAGFDSTLGLLTRSVVLGHKYAGRQFQSQGTGGSIVTTASAAGFQGGWSAAGYTIAKHAVIGVVRQAAVELGHLKIRSNAIAPGIVMTPIMARAFGIPANQSTAFTELLAERTADVQPIGRPGQPEDIANAALFLASDASSFITGSVLTVDGGATAMARGDFGSKAAQAAQDFLSH